MKEQCYSSDFQSTCWVPSTLLNASVGTLHSEWQATQVGPSP